MKTLICLIGLFILSIQTFSQSQKKDSLNKSGSTNSVNKFKKDYTATIITVNSKLWKGRAEAISDSAFTLYQQPNKYPAFNYDDIDMITLRKKGRIGKGILIGAITGAASGTILGLIAASGSEGGFFEISAGEGAGMGFFGGAITGGIIGAIVGAVAKKTFTIHGKQEKFAKMKNKLHADY